MDCDSSLRQLARGLYYSPLPTLVLDAENRVLDYNVAMDVLAGEELNGCRSLPLNHIIPRLAHRIMQGTLFPDAHGSSEAKCTLSVKGLGSIILELTETVCHDRRRHQIVGRILSWKMAPPTQEDLFHKSYRESLDHQLTWDTYASSYDRILGIMPYYREVLDRHHAALAATAPGGIADLGAGTGNLAEMLVRTGRELTAVDNSRAMLDKLRSKPGLAAQIGKRLTVIEASAEFLPMLADAAFSGVSILLAMFDMRAPEQGLATAIRILRPGGTLVITELRRCFRLAPILDACKRHLGEIGRLNELAEDLDRVVKSNEELAQPRFPAEDVFETLTERGFHVSFENSHFDQCATITGRKPGGLD